MSRKMFASFIFFPLLAFSEPAKYSAVNFSGFANYPEKLVVSSCSIVRDGSGFSADADVVKKFLLSEPFIESFKVKSGSALSIEIRERESFLRLAISGSDGNYFAELSENFEVISSGRVFSQRPMLVVSVRDFRQNRLSPAIVSKIRAVSVFLQPDRFDFPVSEIDLTDGEKAVLLFKGRRTRFYSSVDAESFRKVAALVAHFDKAGGFPGRIRVNGGVAVLN